MSDTLIVYGHAMCPGVGPARAMLASARVAHTYVDIHSDVEAAAYVRSVNNGNESVPTLRFPDGSVLSEPSAMQLKAKLEALGFRVGLVAWLLGNTWLIVLAIGVAFALLRLFDVF